MAKKHLKQQKTIATKISDYCLIGGGRWIRTIESCAGRFTVCSLWPLGNPSR
jgi:hypothetical protein